MSIFIPRFTQEVSPFGHCSRDFAPLSRYFDELDRAVSSALKEHSSAKPALPKFNPRFDVQETEEAYQLTGELPGFDQKDINIQFTNENTLSISGNAKYTRKEALRPTQTAAIEKEATPEPTESSDTASEHSYQQPTVEDDDVEIVEKPTSDSEGAVPQIAIPTEPKVTRPQPEQPQSKYWISERSVGEFQRTFKFPFPKRIDQDAVKASLKNGILNVVVPKVKAPAPRTITVE